MSAEVDEKQDSIAAEPLAAPQSCAPTPADDAALTRSLEDALNTRLRAAPTERLQSIVADATRTAAARRTKPSLG